MDAGADRRRADADLLTAFSVCFVRQHADRYRNQSFEDGVRENSAYLSRDGLTEEHGMKLSFVSTGGKYASHGSGR